MSRLTLLTLLAFCGCNFLLGKIGVERCTEDTSACDEAGVLSVCEKGELLVQVDCASQGLACNNIAGECTLCGNNSIDGAETCDDGNFVDGDGCGQNCQLEAICGDGILTVAVEACDDGNQDNGDGCSGDCQRVESCGDNVVDVPAEECDDGNTINGDACEANCTNPVCGNGIIDPGLGEECDDGNLTNGDACSNCRNPVCGNNIVETGEACDDGNNNQNDGCGNDCAFTSCGDGTVQAPEECDDANLSNTDTCNVNCQNVRCGNGFVDGNDQCDDGNATQGDSCENNCTLPVCGNAIEDGGEQCDDGNQIQTDACLIGCLDARCGDTFVRAGVEECDDGNQNNTDGCRNDCKVPACGDGVVDTNDGEECDDGNNNNNDGCNAQCQSECGNGVINGTEACDDGNNNNNDGCNNLCVLEANFFVDCTAANNGNGSLGSPFKTISAAITAASAAQNKIMILPKAGQVCNEGVNVNKTGLAIYGIATLTYPLPTLPTISNTGPAITINNTITTSISGLKLTSTGNSAAVAIFNSNNSNIALTGVDIVATGNGSGARALSCDGNNTKLLINRAFIHDSRDGIITQNQCSLFLVNSVVHNTGFDLDINTVSGTSVRVSHTLFNDDNITISCGSNSNHLLENVVTKRSNNLDISGCGNNFACTDPPLSNGGEGGVFAPFHLASGSSCRNSGGNPSAPSGFNPVSLFSALTPFVSFDALAHDVKGANRPGSNRDKGPFEE